MTRREQEDLLAFYRLFLEEAGLPSDTLPDRAAKVLASKIKRSRSEAAVLGWKRKRARDRAKKAAATRKRKKREAEKLRIKRSKARKKGWVTRRKRAAVESQTTEQIERSALPPRLKKQRLHDLGVAVGEVKPRDKRDQVIVILGRAKLADEDRIYAFRNDDGSVDGELVVNTNNDRVDLDIMTIGENLVLEPNMFVSVGIHARVINQYKYRSKVETRPSDPLGGELDELSAFYTNWYPSGREVNAFIVSRELAAGQISAPAEEQIGSIVFNVVESDVVGEVTGISIRVHWNKRGKPPR